MPSFLLPLIAPPPKLKVTPVFEARERYQRRINKLMNRAFDDNQSSFDQRYMLGAKFNYGETLKGQVVYLYGNSEFWQKSRNYSVQNSDLFLAEADDTFKSGEVMLGRQILSLGGQRMLESAGFGNRLKSFDLARYHGYGFDVFAGRAAVQPVSGDLSKIAGVAHHSSFTDSLLLFKHDRSISHQDFWTVDQRFALKRKLGYEVEGAAQQGRVNGLQERGWFLHGRIGTALGKDWGTWIEADAFSGGVRGKDGLQWTHPYPPAHDWYGVANMFGPRNLNALQANISYQIPKGPVMMLSYNRFSLRDPSDGWYSTTNGLMKGPNGVAYIDPTGKSGRGLADELDLRLKYPTGKHGYFWVEAANLQPGSFIKSFNGKNSTNQWWGFIAYTAD